MTHEPIDAVRRLEAVETATDTRDLLAHATKQARAYEDYFLVDIDAHVSETQFWPEILELVEDEVIRQMGQSALRGPGVGATSLLNLAPGIAFQSLYGRIPHNYPLSEEVAPGKHRFIELVRRGMNALGVDYQVIFPTQMLLLGMHPQDDMEAAVAGAYNRWLVERILPQDDRIKGMIYLPFNTPEAAVKEVEKYAGNPNVIGYMVASTRNKPVHHNSYMRLYSLIEETGKPIAFHSGFHWGDPSFAQLNRFISMHALSFVHYNMIHLTNWVINAIPERFPKLKVIWVESGLAWAPFLMQRIDHEYLMRVCEAPMLKRLPSEYMREMYFTTQPLERNNMNLLKGTFEAINAETQLLFASDWPHWDFDTPRSVTSIPFLGDEAKRNILGLNAARLFGLEPKKRRPPADEVLASRPGVS